MYDGYTPRHDPPGRQRASDSDNALTCSSQQLRRLRTLIGIQREVLLGTREIDSLRQRVADLALEIAAADGAAVDEEDNGDMIAKAVAGTASDQQELRLPLDRSPSGQAYRLMAMA